MSISEASRHVNRVLHGFLADMQAAQIERIKADPRAHRLTRIMADGKPARYRYYPAGKNRRGQEVWFCWSSHRNAAGYFLCWRETWMRKVTKRDQWDATPSKKDAIDLAQRRRDRFKEEMAT